MEDEFKAGWQAARAALFTELIHALDGTDDDTPLGEVRAALDAAWHASASPETGTTGPMLPAPPPLEHHAARSSDPGTSKGTVYTRALRWDKLNGRALRVHYDARHDDPAGLTDWECVQRAESIGGLGACGWKRVGELRTEYDPPLIAQIMDEYGEPVVRRGRYGDSVSVWKITDEGIKAWLVMLGTERELS